MGTVSENIKTEINYEYHKTRGFTDIRKNPPMVRSISGSAKNFHALTAYYLYP